MAAFRYWRLITRVPETTHVLFAEVQFRTSIGGANVISGGTASASSFEAGTNTPDHAIDGNPATDWSPSNFTPGLTAWWQYDFGAGNEKDIVEVYLQSRPSLNAYNPEVVWLARSNDGVTWENASNVYGMKGMTPGVPIVFPASAAAVVFPDGMAHTVDRLASTWPPAGPRTARALDNVSRLVLEVGGQYRIEGTVAIDDEPTDIPVRRRVRLYRRVDGFLVAETFSDAITGAYVFTGLKLQKYFVIAHDDESNIYNATIKDAITPELV